MPRRVQVLEEIWALLASERTAKYLQSCQKLARSYGVANISVAHRIADLRAQADDGTATAKVGLGLLADTQTRILFRQPSDQVAEATELLGLSEQNDSSFPDSSEGEPSGTSATAAPSYITTSLQPSSPSATPTHDSSSEREDHQ